MAVPDMPSLRDVLREIANLSHKVDELQDETAPALKQVLREMAAQRNMTTSINSQLATVIVEMGKLHEIVAKNGNAAPTPPTTQKRARTQVLQPEGERSDEDFLNSAPLPKRKRPNEVNNDTSMLGAYDVSPSGVAAFCPNRSETSKIEEVIVGFDRTSSSKTRRRIIYLSPTPPTSRSEVIRPVSLPALPNSFAIPSSTESIGTFTSASQSSDWPSAGENSFTGESVTSFRRTVHDQAASSPSSAKYLSAETSDPHSNDAANSQELSRMSQDTNSAGCKSALEILEKSAGEEDQSNLITSSSEGLKRYDIRQRQTGWLCDGDSSSPGDHGISLNGQERRSRSISKDRAEEDSKLSSEKPVATRPKFCIPPCGWLVDNEPSQPAAPRDEPTEQNETTDVEIGSQNVPTEVFSSFSRLNNSTLTQEYGSQDEGITLEEFEAFQAAECDKEIDRNERNASVELATARSDSGDVTSDSDDERVTGARIPHIIAKTASFKPQKLKEPRLPDPIWDQYKDHVPKSYIALRQLPHVKDREKIPKQPEVFWRKEILPVLGNTEVAPNLWRPNWSSGLKSKSYYLFESSHQPLLNDIPGRHGLFLTPLPEKEAFKDMRLHKHATPLFAKLFSGKIMYLGHFTQAGDPQKLTSAERELFLNDGILNLWADIVHNVTRNTSKYELKYAGHLRSFLKDPLLRPAPSGIRKFLIPNAMAQLNKDDILKAFRKAPDESDGPELKLPFYWQQVKAIRFDHDFYNKLVNSANAVRQEDKDKKAKKSMTVQVASPKVRTKQRENPDVIDLLSSSSVEDPSSHGADGATDTTDDNFIVVQPREPKRCCPSKPIKVGEEDANKAKDRLGEDVTTKAKDGVGKGVATKVQEGLAKEAAREDDTPSWTNPTNWTHSLRDYLIYIIRDLKRIKDYASFAVPVDPIRLNIPNYFDFDAQPMDLSTIQIKLTRDAYQSLEDVVADMKMIVSNSLAFHGAESLIATVAQDMEVLFHEHLAQLYQ